MKKLTLNVEGMMCGMCEKHVNNAVRNTAEIIDVVSSHTAGTTEILYDGDIAADSVKAAICEEGYTVTGMTYSAE